MTRKIKFRGKKHTDEWLYGDLVHSTDNKIFIYPLDCEGLFLQNEVDTNTIGQFTGLYDKNGREIYEGDIVKSTFTTYIVTWDKECACFSLKEDNTPHLLADYIDDIEVFGNIYDNPELLNK